MIVEPATEDRIKEYYGEALPVSLRGFVVLNDAGEVIGVTGFIRKSVGVRVIFSEGKPEAYTDKRMVMRLTRKMMKIADDAGWTLIADPDKTIETSQHFLGRLGFEPDEEGVYVRWPVSQQQSLT